MALWRTELTTVQYPGEIPRDHIVNVVYHTRNDLIGAAVPADYTNHATELATLFAGLATGSGATFQVYHGRQITANVYDMADALPRPVKGTHQVAFSGVNTETSFGPRHTELCLSFYSSRNLPRQRGRIYIGPWLNTAQAYRPSSAQMAQLIDLGHGLFDIGGEDIAHVVYSPTSTAEAPASGPVTHVVSTYWCNDVWDVLRGRMQKESTRQTLSP